MTPDDPRHGTYAGHNAGCRDDCCRTAARNYQKRRVYEATPRLVSSLGTRRRIEALACLGWSMYDIAERLGLTRDGVRQWIATDTVLRSTHARMAALYDELSMTLPSTETRFRRQAVSKIRNRAANLGYAPPLAWDCIDDPNERPATGRATPRRTDIDPAVVLRVINGDRLPMTPAERIAVVNQMRAAGWSLVRIEQHTGITKPERLTTEDVA